jgi:RNA polymerase sigma-70 factor (ECF subfamily)
METDFTSPVYDCRTGFVRPSCGNRCWREDIAASDSRVLVHAGAVMTKTHETVALTTSFDTVVLSNLDAAYRLAVWLVGNEHDAEDAVQDAALRAFRHLDTFTGGNARAWFLRIVRNVCYDFLGRRRLPVEILDDDTPVADVAPGPEALLLRADDAAAIRLALADLPAPLREILALRELEDLTYREIAELLDVPTGTVMSRLSRARAAFRERLVQGTTAREGALP